MLPSCHSGSHCFETQGQQRARSRRVVGKGRPESPIICGLWQLLLATAVQCKLLLIAAGNFRLLLAVSQRKLRLASVGYCRQLLPTGCRT